MKKSDITEQILIALEGKQVRCTCKNIEVGSYCNQVELVPPSWWLSSHKTICVDRCLELEVKFLWGLGIRTTGCCCGHNGNGIPYIGVEDEDIATMKELGYERRHNPCRPNDNDSFIPRTV
jgi:hypothetical protein